MVKKVSFIYLLLLISFNIFSEVDIDATLTGAFTGTKLDGGSFTNSVVALGSLSIESENSNYVKSQLVLDFTSLRNVSVLSISKAWIKFRYPLFRFTIGKTRITWGEGSAFNAGDVIFDDYKLVTSSTEDIDLTADELKSLNRTMAEIIIPLGRFTYGELIYLPFDFPLYITSKTVVFNSDGDEAEAEEYIVSTTPDYESALEFSEHSFGGRFVTKLAGIKLETGYIYNGNLTTHKPYISLNGTLGLDYYFSSSINILNGETSFNNWKDTLKISSGFFYLFELKNDKTLTFRLESLIEPYKNWDLDALKLYPEIAFVPNEEFSFFLRSIINPLNFNLEGTLGVNWKTYPGFSIGAFVSVLLDSEESSEISLTVSVTHKF